MEISRNRIVEAPLAAWRSYQRLTQLSFPRSYPLVQFPNPPLIIAFVAAVAAQYSRGSEHADARAVSYLSMAVWAYRELFQGSNAFRRLLGLAVAVATAVHLARALNH